MLANEYGWSETQILDQPYCKLEELVYQIRLRQYVEAVRTYNVQALAHNGGSSENVNAFFNSLKPKRHTVTQANSVNDAPGSLDKLYIPDTMKHS